MTTTTAPYRVARIEHEGQTYYPVVRDGKMLGLDDLEVLARMRDAVAPVRQMLVVLADEGPPRPGSSVPPIRVAGLQVEAGVPVTYLDSQLVIGRCEDILVLPAGVLAGTTGEVLAGAVVLRPTRLAALAWDAVRIGFFNGLCPEIADFADEDGFMVSGRITRVLLGDSANSCLPGARIVRYWEGATVL
jgi:hypothetical protein